MPKSIQYKVNFINASYRRFYEEHRWELLEAFDRCASKGDFILRKDVEKFEQKLAKFIGVKHAVGVNSGTDALKLSLKALGIKQGDEVITVSHTFIATIESIVDQGATPILIDVKEDGLMNVDQLEPAITERTKAVIPVHLSGKVCDMTRIMEIARRRNIAVVEDSCQALGAYWGEKKAGSFGDTGCFSFISAKLIGAYGDAGVIVTDNDAIYENLLLRRNHWNINQMSVKKEDFPEPQILGWAGNSRLDNIQAAILNVKFKYLPKMLRRRRQIAMRYNEGLEDLLALPIQQEKQIYQEYIVRVPEIQKFADYMKKQRIELLIRDIIPNHKREGLGLAHFNLPVTETMAQNQVRLPIYPELYDSEVKYIIKSIRKFYGA